MGWLGVLFVFMVYVGGAIDRSLASFGDCEVQLHGDELNETDGLIAYLKVLIENRDIEYEDLLKFISSLEKNSLENPISREQADINSRLMVHWEGIERYFVEDSTLDLNKILQWARSILNEESRVQIIREEVLVETKDISQKIELHEVPPGSFQMYKNESYTEEASLSHAMAVMSTPLTQKQWVELMGENPSRFQVGESTTTLNMNGKEIKLQPDHPVENITWWSAVFFANQLSEKHGLKPAYDLSGLILMPGSRLEKGSLDTKAGRLRVNAEYNDIYSTEGYRLPTVAEQRYLLTRAGASTDKYPFQEEEILQYGWFLANSDQRTHAVGQLNPLNINRHNFYDLYGNVFEWSYDWWTDSRESPRGGLNLTGSAEGKQKFASGGSWFHEPWGFSTSITLFPWVPQAYLGVRFVRTLK